MQQFSIKAMERLSGIKAHTLRIWEQRYGILQPSRKEGNHRYYSNDDLKTLLRVVFLYEKGHRIGEIARLTQDGIQHLIHADQEDGLSAKANILMLIDAVLDFDEDAMDKIYHRITRQYGFSGAMLEVVFPLLNKIGLLWISDRLSPGQEHFATNYFLRKILHAQNEIEKGFVQQQGLVMLFTPKAEFHELGLLFMGYLLRLNGYKTVYIGTNADAETIDVYYQRNRPAHLYVYLTGNLQEEEPGEYLQTLVHRYPDAQIVAGGMVVKEIQDIPGCKILRNSEDMQQFSSNLME